MIKIKSINNINNKAKTKIKNFNNSLGNKENFYKEFESNKNYNINNIIKDNNFNKKNVFYPKQNNKIKIINNKKIEKNYKINEYFKENTNEYNLFKNIENNIFLYCTKTKTAILIIDSFCKNENKTYDVEGKKYLKSILSKINNAKTFVIILTNNFNILLNKKKKSFEK